ncbi:MAG: hypothetical protein P4M09_16845 [Devosia sp.]|nr:hypothetical protein [Devosia sp.]
MTSQSALAANLTAAIDDVQSAVTAVGTLEGASLVALAPVIAAVETAEPVFASAINALDGDISLTSVGGVVAGGIGPDMAQTLLLQTSEVQQLALVLSAKSRLLRIATNIKQATG